MAKITVKDTEITVINVKDEDYFCLTDMIKANDGDFFITDWLRNRNTLEYIGIWEQVYNPDFNYGEFAIIKSQSEFKIYIVKEFQRLKEEEQKMVGWSAKCELAKINYRIHTDAIKQNLIPSGLTPLQKSHAYADEADMLNVGRSLTRTYRVFACKNSQAQFASLRSELGKQPKIATNMENLIAVFINDKLSQTERLEKLNKIAIQQMKILENIEDRKLLTEKSEAGK